MMKKILFAYIVLTMVFGITTTVFAEEDATRDEVIAMCKAAAEMLMQDKEAGIAEVANINGKFVWKNTYVFLMNMEGRMLAHPAIPQLTEKTNLLDLVDKNKDNPKKIIIEFINIAKTNGDGWIWYKWPKPNSRTPVDKFTYIHRVGFTDLFVGAGIYK